MFINKYQVLPRERYYISILFIGFSFLFLFYSFTLYSNAKKEPNFKKKQAEDIMMCSDFIKDKGLVITRPNDMLLEVTSSDASVVNGEPAIMFSSIESILLKCKNIQLKSFCLGVSSECGVDGVKMLLGYIKPNAK